MKLLDVVVVVMRVVCVFNHLTCQAQGALQGGDVPVQSREGQGDTGTPTAPSPLPLSGFQQDEHWDEPPWSLRSKGSTWTGGMWAGQNVGPKSPAETSGCSSGEGDLPSPSWSTPNQGAKGRVRKAHGVRAGLNSSSGPSSAARSCAPRLPRTLP